MGLACKQWLLGIGGITIASGTEVLSAMQTSQHATQCLKSCLDEALLKSQLGTVALNTLKPHCVMTQNGCLQPRTHTTGDDLPGRQKACNLLCMKAAV